MTGSTLRNYGSIGNCTINNATISTNKYHSGSTSNNSLLISNNGVNSTGSFSTPASNWQIVVDLQLHFGIVVVLLQVIPRLLALVMVLILC